MKGLKNGDLLRAAEVAGYDVPLTVDQGIPHQQTSAARGISVILIRARTNQLEDLVPLTEAISRLLETIGRGAMETVQAF